MIRLAYAALWLWGGLLYLLPFRLKQAVAWLLGLALFEGLRVRRNVTLHNLATALPREPDETMGAFRNRCESLGRRHYAHLVLNFFETLERFHWTEDFLRRHVRIDGFEHIQRLQADGRGFFFLTAHLGNWELISLVGRLLGVRLTIITRYLRNRFADELWKRSRLRYGVELLEESGSGLGILRALREGKAVGFILDQFTGEPHGIQARFFGVTTWCPKGLAILSQKRNTPVVPAYLVREPGGSYRVIVEAPLVLPQEGIVAHVEACNQNIETWARRYPEQYLWVHKRFKGSLDYAAPLPWFL